MADQTEAIGGRSPAEDRRETILIIEDDPGVAKLESRTLRRAGFAVECAGTTTQALNFLEKGGIDLIVLDQKLEGDVSGLDFYEQLRADGNETPAILVTGLSDEQTLIRAMRVGLRDFVPKTVDYFDDLAVAVDRVLTQVRTSRKLAESEARLAGITLLAEAIPQIIWTARPDGYIDYFNRRWFEYTSLTMPASIGWNWCRMIHPDDLDRVAERWTESLESGSTYEVEYRLKRGVDGSFRWFLARGTLVLDQVGHVHKWFGTCTDIDDQKRNQQELRRANEIAETASRAKDQFLAMLSHELRTPLTPVLMIAAAASEDADTPEHLRPTFDMIRQNLELEARLIDDLLDVMRIIRGKMPYHFEVVNTHVQIARAVEICRAEADGKGLTIVTKLEASDSHVRADTARLQQVLWNLIKNAIKFTPKAGKVLIETRSTDGHFICKVIDTGIGIEPAHLSQIFNAFEQGEDAITKRFGGLGLGLAISRSIIDGHGGDLVATSQGRDQGACFTLTLAIEASIPTVEINSENLIPGEGDSDESNLDYRLLLVEDDVMTARIMAKLLRQNGYTVTTANSMAGGLEVPSSEYDLLVSDIGLPDGTGLELMRIVKLRHDVPGIALTGFGMEEDIRKSREAGFVAHLTKPLDFAKLDAMIKKVVAEHGVRP